VATAWYSDIAQHNFNATRVFPLTAVPKTIYLLGLVPKLLILLGAGNFLWQNRTPRENFKSSDALLGLRMRETVTLLLLLQYNGDLNLGIQTQRLVILYFTTFFPIIFCDCHFVRTWGRNDVSMATRDNPDIEYCSVFALRGFRKLFYCGDRLQDL